MVLTSLGEVYCSFTRKDSQKAACWVLISNQVVDPIKVQRVAALAQGSQVECLVEIECGQGRCRVEAGGPAARLAQQIEQSSGLRFAGIQAYQGAAQHLRQYHERERAIAHASDCVRATLAALDKGSKRCHFPVPNACFFGRSSALTPSLFTNCITARSLSALSAINSCTA